MNPATTPAPRYSLAMAYDPDIRETVLFGGEKTNYYNDTWLCDIDEPWGQAGGCDAAVNYTAIAWDPTGERAIIVGNSGTDSVVYDYYEGRNYISRIPDKDNTFQNHQLYGAAYQPLDTINAEVMLVGASAFKIIPNAIDQGTQITANGVKPQLYWIGFNDTAHNSKLEQQVSPDDWYEFSFAANYSQGWLNTEVLIHAWYDNGAIGDASNYPAETESNRCLAINITYDVGASITSMTYPVFGLPECNLGAVTDVVVPGGTPGEDIHYVTIAVYLGPQARAADGNGFSSGDADTDPLKNNALLDANSWDFNITVRDAIFHDANKTLYSEFGIEKQVSVSVTGNPSGNTPPGSSDVALAIPSQITYSANTNYWVNVSIPDLLENGVGPANIAATNIGVANVNVFAAQTYTEMNGADYPVGRTFTGANQDLCVWGNRTEPQTYISAPSNGSVAFGPFGSNYNAVWTTGAMVTTQLDWWVTVPGGTNEGVYWAVITITIDS